LKNIFSPSLRLKQSAWYKFDPNSIESKQPEIDDQHNNSEQHQQIKYVKVQIQQKQLTLKDMWKY
jgi:hypothetical protein